MTLSRRSACAAFCALLWRREAGAQEATTAPAPPVETTPLTRFQSQVIDVIVPVTVTDDKGRFVSNLVAADFRVFDEGRPQRIEFFSHQEKQPTVVGFLVDLSNATRIHWKTFQDALKELVWALLPGDTRFTGYLIGYSNEAELLANTTWDPEKLITKVDRMKPGGGAALFDALYMACTSRELVKGEPFEPRRVIIVMGDGHDSTSSKSLAEVLELAQRELVTIYGVSTQAYGFDTGEEDTLERLARATGGHVERPLNSLYKDVSGYLSTPSDEGNYALAVGTGGYAAEIGKGIMKAVGGITNEVTTQYVLRYKPDVDSEAKQRDYRRIRVEVPNLPGIKIYAREGYFIPDEARAAPATAPAPAK